MSAFLFLFPKPIMQTIEQLNTQFALDDSLYFEKNAAGVPFIYVNNRHAKAYISVYGGQVLSYKPHSAADDLLYLSDKNCYEQGKAIRGGIPICWPWFGDAEIAGFPPHGFARNVMWRVIATEFGDGDTSVTLAINPSLDSANWWNDNFELRMQVTIGATLDIALTTINQSDKPFIVTQALHTYFNVGNVSNISIHGLSGFDYLDKTQNYQRYTQQGDLRFDKEVDNVYLQPDNTVYIVDPDLNRRIKVESTGSKSTVVWNPWHKAALLADMQDDDYRRFVCVEAANALEDRIEIAPGESYCLAASYQILAG